jgi:glycerophosphoryl diester phosphodiesterase
MTEPYGAQHWKRNVARGPILLGHRGVRRPSVTENTLEAFELARLEGAAGVELDVRLDAAGGAIVLHDAVLERVTAGRDLRAVERVPAQEMRTLALAHGERVPGLDDALAWSRQHDMRLNIELKNDVSDKRRLLRAVAAAVQLVSDAPERIVLSSFDPRLVLGLRLLLPEVACAWLVHEGQRVLRHAPGLRLIGAVGVHPQAELLSPRSLRAYRRKAGFVGTWTVNDPARARQLASWGVDTIISDCPGVLRAALTA